ncbi:DUF2147 domain-containing protein [Agrobacterium radiobacter]|uniref:DUF2147 domain-containing protein n=1 Tax=Agrobacterium radiobacter TaxID=362 RepID=UPI001606E985|nr:DUF2147 domain-containing protein [Agrobacterium radiobacter]MBB4402900.1 uncharacterized protein (DUF2147 family) [Agrobacterium radiobacter]MBB5589189.1 uncharacterized protein (DUF2147 family) [Agrobacterium radiobacter]
MHTLTESRRSLLLVALAMTGLAVTGPTLAQQASQDAFLGKWAADDGSVRLEMFKAGAELRAHLLFGNQIMERDNTTFKSDAKNPDPALRSRSLENIVFIHGLRWDDGQWTEGTLYDPSSGRTYRCTVEMKGNKMLLRGYLGISLLGQTREFHRF